LRQLCCLYTLMAASAAAVTVKPTHAEHTPWSCSSTSRTQRNSHTTEAASILQCFQRGKPATAVWTWTQGEHDHTTAPLALKEQCQWRLAGSLSAAPVFQTSKKQ
jgi:hypothetical protein